MSPSQNSSDRRCIVITGASSGIGKASAEAFARMGWHIICTGRDPERCADAEEEINAVAAPGARIDFVRGDFTEMREVKRVAEEIAELTDRIHVHGACVITRYTGICLPCIRLHPAIARGTGVCQYILWALTQAVGLDASASRGTAGVASAVRNTR